MKARKFSTEQIIGVLKEHDAGISSSDLCRKHGISKATFYIWKKKFSGMNVSDAKRLKSVEEENRKLKRLVAEQALDIIALKEVNSKKW